MRARSTAASTIRHAVGVGVEAVLLVAIVAALSFGVALATGHPASAGSVFAAKGGSGGGHGGGGSATNTYVTITIPNGTFDGVTTASVTGASGLWVHVICNAFSGGGEVAWAATDNSGLAVIQLGPTPSWSSGGASCTGEAGTFDAAGNWTALASTGFAVAS